MVDELAEIGVAGRNLRIIPAGERVAVRIELVLHRLGELDEGVVPHRERDEVREHEPELAGIPDAREGMKRFRLHAAYAVAMHRELGHAAPLLGAGTLADTEVMIA
ncbi:hypothetical protein [Enterovirga sp. CN4-39]|uniref:hypothetical protein n=1 Tax=Enterovirga sp. CN4-39 TaxID=3400910 RepID=UPI003C02CC6A